MLSVTSSPGTSSTLLFFQVLERGVRRLTSAGVGTPQLDAEVLLAFAAGKDRTWLYAHLHDSVGESLVLLYEELLTRRARREPVQYIVGHQEFWSLDFEVNPSVLIPRPETERLVELVVGLAASLQPTAQSLTLCEIGTGSGCLAVAIATELRQARIVATDLSPAALAVARHNAERHRVADRIRFVEADLFGDVRGPFDFIVSNPPYVALAEYEGLQPELHFEPESALFAGDDGLTILRRLLPQAHERLVDGGAVLVEFGATQAGSVLSLAREVGFAGVQIENDLAGLPRLLVARK